MDYSFGDLEFIRLAQRNDPPLRKAEPRHGGAQSGKFAVEAARVQLGARLHGHRGPMPSGRHKVAFATLIEIADVAEPPPKREENEIFKAKRVVEDKPRRNGLKHPGVHAIDLSRADERGTR